MVVMMASLMVVQTAARMVALKVVLMVDTRVD
jgi:hypothetical protein